MALLKLILFFLSSEIIILTIHYLIKKTYQFEGFYYDVFHRNNMLNIVKQLNSDVDMLITR